MRNRWIPVVAALVGAVASIVFWSRLPAEVATHWSFSGDVDDHSSRAVAAILAPAVIIALAFVFHFLPKLDPRRANYERFADVYGLITNAIIVLIAVIHVSTLASAAGLPVNVVRVLSGTLAVFLMVLGNVFGRVKQNWFLGIRTPWTLDNPTVWRKTHRVAAWLFVIAGVVTLLGAAVPSVNPMTTAGVATVAAGAGSVAASLLFWLKERRT